jgi:TPR repeat protein
MFLKLQKYFVARKIKKFIKSATNIIYIEESDLINHLEKKLVADKKPFDLLCVYIAIRIAADARTPIDKSHIKYALRELYSLNLAYQNHEEYEAVVGYLKANAEVSLIRAELEFMIAKKAYDTDKYSYQGIMYSIAKAKKGPLSFEERKEFATLAKKIAEAEDELEEHLAKKAEPDCQKQATEQQLKEEIHHLKTQLQLLEDPATINSFGEMAFDGNGTPQDYVEAANWFRIAAEQDYAVAQNNLALMYENGQGVSQDYAEAIKWYRKAAENGDVNALTNLNRLEAKLSRDKYHDIVFAFMDLMAAHRPLIGDCSILPYPKKTILYAIRWLIDYHEAKLEETTNHTLREAYDKMLPTLGYLFTSLARDWQEIDPEDKDAIARLNECESFPDWATPLKLKYIDEEKASQDAANVAFQVIKDRTESEIRKNGPRSKEDLQKERDDLIKHFKITLEQNNCNDL